MSVDCAFMATAVAPVRIAISSSSAAIPGRLQDDQKFETSIRNMPLDLETFQLLFVEPGNGWPLLSALLVVPA